MELIIAYENDAAEYNMAKHISSTMKMENGIYKGQFYDVIIINSPTIYADWIAKYDDYEGYIFLSKHAAKSNILSLTCHSTGIVQTNSTNQIQQVSTPHPYLQKSYIRSLWNNRNNFQKFKITLEATHHGPSSLHKPTLFIEIGTTETQWNDVALCRSISEIVMQNLPIKKSYSTSIDLGGTHYPDKFTNEIIHGKYAFVTIIPSYNIKFLNRVLFNHILKRNYMANSIIIDTNELKMNDVSHLISNLDMEIIRI